MKLSINACAVGLSVALLSIGVPAAAEVTRSTESSFVSRHEVVVKATPKDVWLALISPGTWWRSEHTWSGDSKNLTLMPQAGGCFCETIPEVDGPSGFTLQGSVEHMRVVQAYPEVALRMVGNLGPLQSEPVAGVLTIAITAVDAGTRLVWEYNVGGPMRYEVEVISKAVDGVMGAQLAALSKPLGIIAEAPSVETIGADNAATATGQGDAVAAPALPSSGRPTQAPGTPAPKVMPSPAPKAPSVQDSFGDLGTNSPP